MKFGVQEADIRRIRGPVAFQVYGDDPGQIVEAALRIQDLGPDTIDLNMGCPAKSIPIDV